MTLIPSPEFGIRGHDGNAYKVNEICAHPTCSRYSAHAHHCWSRSYLRGQPYEFVQLPDGTVIGNRLGFCVEHHEMLTGEIGGYRARLTWHTGLLWWEDKFDRRDDGDPLWTNLGPTSVQPPTEGQKLHENDHAKLGDDATCPTCGHHKRKPDDETVKPKPARKVKEWTMAVPDDVEDGADLLDAFIEDFAIPMGASDWSPRLKRYYVTSMVFAWVSTVREEFIADLAEAAERRLASGSPQQDPGRGVTEAA